MAYTNEGQVRRVWATLSEAVSDPHEFATWYAKQADKGKKPDLTSAVIEFNKRGQR